MVRCEIAIDITERVIMRENLKKSQARYQSILESQKEFLCRFLPDYTLTFVNEALCALRALIYMTLLGKEGFRDVARHCHSKAEYLKSRLIFATVLNEGPTFNEFAVRLPRDASEVAERLVSRGFLAGLPLAALDAGGPNDLLIAVTEKRTRHELDAFAKALEEACN